MIGKIIVGVTGGIATGKSTVLSILAEFGAATIDADAVYHELVAPTGRLVEPIAARFGPTVVAADGSIDRRALGVVVFSDPAALADLEAITHPAVVAEVWQRAMTCDRTVIAIDAVKLIESGMNQFCDFVWLVVCDPDVQRARLMARNGIDRAEADRRVAAQPDESARRKMADLVIDNSADVSDLTAQIKVAWNVVSKLTN